MGERGKTAKPEEMATTSTAVVSTVPLQVEEPAQPIAVITLRPTKTQARKKVVWTEDTVDNEDMNKKKSKCCCIYEKPHKFGESDSESDSDECEHCFGHVERRKKPGHTHTHSQPGTSAQAHAQENAAEPTVTVSLQPDDSCKLDDKSDAKKPPDTGPDNPTGQPANS